jgi:hypothetical protein
MADDTTGRLPGVVPAFEGGYGDGRFKLSQPIKLDGSPLLPIDSAEYWLVAPAYVADDPGSIMSQKPRRPG